MLGAAIVNDVWGLQRDPDMARVVAEHDTPVIIMHNRDTADPAIDIIADVTEFFRRSLDIAGTRRHPAHRIVLDPGIGFGKTAGAEHRLYRAARRFARLRPAALGRRLAQALHQCDRAVRARSSGSADRWPRIFWRSRTARRSCGFTMWADGAGAGGGCGDQARAMSDAIFVNGLVLHAYHGVMPHEGKVGQTFRLDLELDVDLAEASRTDKLKDTVSYETVVKTASEAFCATPVFFLAGVTPQ